MGAIYISAFVTLAQAGVDHRMNKFTRQDMDSRLRGNDEERVGKLRQYYKTYFDKSASLAIPDSRSST
jgi:hypothetical protein